MPSSFRRENPCAEAISWSPDGNRMAMAFRDPVDNQSEFCVVQLHQLKLEDSDTPQPLPKDRLTSKRTSIHQRGISAIDWLPTGFGPETTSRQVITTGSSDHAVMLWEEHEDVKNGGLDLKFSVLHRDHRSEVRSLCVHSKRDCLYTGGLDGLMIRYDLNEGCTQIVIERRKPHISKINAVLEHPHNPNLLLVSCVEQSSHNLLLHDLRQPYEPNGMSLTWQGGTMSHKTGVVNIWDVRMRGEKYPAVLPQQSLRVHHKTVLHATWHPRYDAMFSVSHDRTLGLLTFRLGEVLCAQRSLSNKPETRPLNVLSVSLLRELKWMGFGAENHPEPTVARVRRSISNDKELTTRAARLHATCRPAGRQGQATTVATEDMHKAGAYPLIGGTASSPASTRVFMTSLFHWA
ncbi:hypothetical protein ON010_g16925 [Phytophthora cinnamomi]|nr:hypothetical protein ON010_g16925 [Phytophthora cinnamomi]